MAYKLNSLKTFTPLLTAINTVKSGSNDTLVVGYFINRDSFEDLSKVPSDINAITTDIQNALFQWQSLFT